MKICRRCKKEFDGKRCNYCQREYYNTHKVESAAYQKAWYIKNKEKLKEHRIKHKEEIIAYAKKYYKENRAELITRKKEYYEKHQEERLAYAKEYRRLNPLKVKAHDILKYAVRSGNIIRQPCSICKKAKVEAHHPDYNKPLEVIWLCNTHHKRLHAELKES